MSIFLPALGVAFTAFCIWLAVRILNRRERWAKWMAVVLTLLAYPLSFGPACWLVNQGKADIVFIASIYRPFVRAAGGVNVMARLLRWYGDLDRPSDTPSMTNPMTTIPMTGWMNFALSLHDDDEI